MKSLLYFKYCDRAAQGLAALAPLVWAVAKADIIFALICYITVGIVQSIS